MKTALFILASVFPLVSCARHGSIHNPIVVQPEESYDVFADLLSQNASRIETEVIAALGKDYEKINFAGFNGPNLKRDVVKSLNNKGISRESPYGNVVHRVTKTSQAKAILARTWPYADFSADSKIDILFQNFPNASVVLMECDNQRILFFDKDERLVAVYPERGGGC